MRKRDQERPRTRPTARPGLERVEARLLMAVVTTIMDSGPGSLRQALTDLAAVPSTAANPNTITFDINDPAPVIEPHTALPPVLSPVVIDGSNHGDGGPLVTISGANVAEAVILDPANPPPPATGLAIRGGGSTIRDLVVDNYFKTNETGITLDGSGGNAVLATFLGTDTAGNRGLGNYVGLRLVNGSSGNTIGGNVISGNNNIGIRISGGGQGGNLLVGNKIGVSPSGLAPLGNADEGIYLQDSPDNTIGGTTADQRNLIGGNSGNGIGIVGALSNRNRIQGNLIGTVTSDSISTSGTTLEAFRNNRDGIVLIGASSNTVGGSVAGARNVISGNVGNGVEIRTGLTATNAAIPATNNVISGNYIGTDDGGTSRIQRGSVNNPGNQLDGIRVDGSNGDVSGNRIGGETAAERNVISGNGGDGISVVGFDNNGFQSTPSMPNAPVFTGGVEIVANYLGLDANGRVKLANGGSGVFLFHATGVTIGGPRQTARNVISGNLIDGVRINSSNLNAVQGNIVGGDATGTYDVFNNRDGISDGFGGGNTIGGVLPGDVPRLQDTPGNLIFGNNGSGIHLSSVSRDMIQGNTIGLNAASVPSATPLDAQGNPLPSRLIGNNQDGITLNLNSTLNTIGGGSLTGRNVIAGNLKNGISIDNGSGSNTVQGNYVGVDGSGRFAKGNGLNGIYIATPNNTIGGAVPLNSNLGVQTATPGNVVSGNIVDGVVLATSRATGNLVQGNLIGTDYLGGEGPGDPSLGAGGRPIGNRSNGVMVINDATNNTIGGAGAGLGNVISGNGSHGVQMFNILVVDRSATPAAAAAVANLPGNTLQNNIIGLTRFGGQLDGNGGDGVLINQARNNSIGGSAGLDLNVISGNSGHGVEILGSSSRGNVIRGARIGTDINGLYARGNRGSGVSLFDASSNTIGGAAGVGNLISGNAADGVTIASSGGGNDSNFNLLSFNTIGLAIDGTSYLTLDPFHPAALPGNRLDGVRLSNTSTTSTLNFGPLANQLTNNTISANGAIGVEVAGDSKAVVLGNVIGADLSGTVARGNVVGVHLRGAPGNVVGEAGLGNLISGNSNVGIQVDSGSGGDLGVAIRGNLIGTKAFGNGSLGNGVGVFLNDVAGVTIGGTAGAGNMISGNSQAGIVVGRLDSGKDRGGVAIQGNVIGPDVHGASLVDASDPAGGLPVASGQPIGIFLNSAPNTTIGGTAAGAGNVIAGNTQAGISIFGEAVGRDLNNLIQGNAIGADYLGRPYKFAESRQVYDALGNLQVRAVDSAIQLVGVAINGSARNLIGGAVPGARNLIAGNEVGVEVAGIVSGTEPSRPIEGPASLERISNVIQGNLIVTNTFGVFLNGAAYNLVGGAGAAGNDITLNSTIGVAIVGPTSTFNVVQGNLISGNGTSASGAKVEATAADGVFIQAASSNAILENRILDNGQENRPGVDPTTKKPTTLLANGIGVYLTTGSDKNLVARNVITDNSAYGVFLLNSAGNIEEVIRSGGNANIVNLSPFPPNGVADFREFTGNPDAALVKKKADRPNS